MNPLVLSLFIPCVIFIMIILTKRLIASLIISIVLISIILHYDNPSEIIIFIFNKFTAIFYSFNDYSINIGIIYLFLFLILLGVLSEILISTGVQMHFKSG